MILSDKPSAVNVYKNERGSIGKITISLSAFNLHCGTRG